MTSADRNVFVPTQEKLEWVTPKISLMDADETDGTPKLARNETKQQHDLVLPDRFYLKPRHTNKNQ